MEAKTGEGVSGEKGKDGSENWREVKERNLPFSSPPPPSPIGRPDTQAMAHDTYVAMVITH